MLTMYNLCIGELEQMVDEFSQWEGIDDITIENVVPMLLLYTNDMVMTQIVYMFLFLETTSLP